MLRTYQTLISNELAPYKDLINIPSNNINKYIQLHNELVMLRRLRLLLVAFRHSQTKLRTKPRHAPVNSSLSNSDKKEVTARVRCSNLNSTEVYRTRLNPISTYSSMYVIMKTKVEHPQRK